jgi:site-specific DNA-cytosine methylase
MLIAKYTGRHDFLTVRELARLQGFGDDFVFYGEIESQYKEVLSAQPPPMATEIAEAIRRLAMRCRKVEFGNAGEIHRPPKRQRMWNTH